MCFISVAATVVLVARDLNAEKLICIAEGNPTPYVTWIGLGVEVENNSAGEARISTKNLEQGKYTCNATNDVGSDQKSYNMTRKNFFWLIYFCLFKTFARKFSNVQNLLKLL